MRGGRAALALAAVLGCVSAPAGRQATPLDLGELPAAEYERLPPATERGSGTVAGRVILPETAPASRAVAEEAMLVPETSYAAAWAGALAAGRPTSAPDPRFDRYTRRTRPDAEGSFTFGDVPSGRYLLIVSLTRAAPSTRCFTSGGGVLRCLDQVERAYAIGRVLLGEGQRVEVRLRPGDAGR